MTAEVQKTILYIVYQNSMSLKGFYEIATKALRVADSPLKSGQTGYRHATRVFK